MRPKSCRGGRPPRQVAALSLSQQRVRGPQRRLWMRGEEQIESQMESPGAEQRPNRGVQGAFFRGRGRERGVQRWTVDCLCASPPPFAEAGRPHRARLESAGRASVPALETPGTEPFRVAGAAGTPACDRGPATTGRRPRPAASPRACLGVRAGRHPSPLLYRAPRSARTGGEDGCQARRAPPRRPQCGAAAAGGTAQEQRPVIQRQARSFCPPRFPPPASRTMRVGRVGAHQPGAIRPSAGAPAVRRAHAAKPRPLPSRASLSASRGRSLAGCGAESRGRARRGAPASVPPSPREIFRGREPREGGAQLLFDFTSRRGPVASLGPQRPLECVFRRAGRDWRPSEPSCLARESAPRDAAEGVSWVWGGSRVCREAAAAAAAAKAVTAASSAAARKQGGWRRSRRRCLRG